MKLRADNRPLIKDQPTTILTATVSAAGTTLTVKNNSGFSQNDFVLIGKIGEEKTEIKRISAAVTVGTSLTIVAATFDHDQDTPITKLDYDQVEFSHAATETGAKSVLATSNADPSGNYTYYEDASNTTGYWFIRYKDSNQADYSSYSDAIPYTGYTSKMLREIRKKVRRLLNEKDEVNSLISNDEIDSEINITQKELAHSRMWSWLEKIKSFSSVADQYQYTLASDCFVPYEAKYDSQPLAVVDLHRYNVLRWDSDVTGDPTHICLWRKKARVYPYPSSSASATTLGAAISSTTATTITVADNSGLREQGRIIVDDEVISYTGKTSTTSLTGCTRGDEGTTAATHSNGATVTERDFIYYFQEDPDDLADETDETTFPDPSVIAYKAAAELALQLNDETLHDRLLMKYDRAYKQLVKTDESKYKSAFGRVKDTSEVTTDDGLWPNPNDYPQNITGD